MPSKKGISAFVVAYGLMACAMVLAPFADHMIETHLPDLESFLDPLVVFGVPALLAAAFLRITMFFGDRQHGKVMKRLKKMDEYQKEKLDSVESLLRRVVELLEKQAEGRRKDGGAGSPA